jgi:putative transposase
LPGDSQSLTIPGIQEILRTVNRSKFTVKEASSGRCREELATQRECQVIKGHLLPDHIHMLISIPPKYSVSQVVGYLKGKSAIQIARTYMGRKKNFTGQHFWARGYFVTTVGADEKTIRDYIRRQESEDRRLDQLGMFEE